MMTFQLQRLVAQSDENETETTPLHKVHGGRGFSWLFRVTVDRRRKSLDLGVQDDVECGLFDADIPIS